MYEAYIRAGFALVPIIEGKGPTTAGWNKRENCVTSIDRLNPNVGYGIAHSYSGTMSLDIDHYEESKALLSQRGVDLDALIRASDSVMIDSGNPGHAKLLFRLPLGITLTSKKISYVAPDKSKQVAYELRCATANGLTTQCVLPSAINHPKTGRPYRWAGNGHFSKIPTIPLTLLTLWEELTKQDQQRVISTDTIPASWDDIKAALYTIPADCSREHWLTALMAVHHAGSQIDQLGNAEALAHEWSATAQTKYAGPRDFQYVWSSIKADSNGIKTGSLFHLAYQHGYKRPIPDASELFKSVVPEAPVRISEALTLPLPQMNMDLWPKLLTDVANEVAESVGCDPLVPLWAGLGAVCGAVDSQIRLELMPGFSVPPILWLMTIGDPGDKKSPGARPMMGTLKDLEREDRKRYQRRLLEWEALDHVHQQSKKSYIQEAGKSTEILLTGKMTDETLPHVNEMGPPKPIDLRIVVNDVTSQKLVRLLADRPRGLLCHLDEMATWVNKMTDPRSGEDRSCWTKSYESDPYSMDRVGLENSVYADNMAVSIFGNIQPQVFKNKFKQMADDGLLQRFIPAILRSEFQKRGEPVPAMFSSLPQWDMRLRELFTLPSVTYRLDSGAYESYRDFQLWYEGNKKDEKLLNSSPIYMQAYGKLEGTVGRLALVMHLLTNPYSPMVTKALMDRSIAICRTYLIPAYRYVLDETAGLGENSLERWIADRMVQLSGIEQTITIAELRRTATRTITDIPRHLINHAITDAMAPLESAGWVTIINDHHEKRTWAINPNLATIHDAYRVQVIKARQRRMDDLRANVLASGRYTVRKFARGYDPATMDDKKYPE
jgi:hypothetical protein